MVAFPFCKINLGLQILSKRPDGYHTISTCFYPIPWTDVLEILPSSTLRFIQTGITIPGKEEDNLCLKAYHLLAKEFSLSPVDIHLHKIIPTGAGLGGGSSDAAHTLRILNTIFDLKIPVPQLMKYASMLGSDCAYFIQDNPMMGDGKGEILNSIDIDLKGHFIVVLTPGIHVSTAEAYAGVKPAVTSTGLRDNLKLDLSEWKDVVRNDFEESIFLKFPEIEQLKKKLYLKGAVYSSMSGSGSSVFGIFKNEIDWRREFAATPGWSAKL